MIRFQSYNILTSHPKDEDIESIYEKDIGAKSWKYRKLLVVSEIVTADIIVLVEATQLQIDSIISLSKSLYDRSYSYNLMLKRNQYDGTAILFDNTKFIDIDYFSDYLHKHSRTQVVLSMRLFHIHSQKQLLVSGFHLKSGYSDQENRREIEITNGIYKINKWIKSKNIEHIPNIVAGDFNTEHPSSPSSNYESKVVKKMENYFKFKNVFDNYELYNKTQKFYPYITYHYWHPSIFDYIYTKNLEIIDRNIPKINEDDILPNDKYGSDHLPVSCSFRI